MLEDQRPGTVYWIDHYAIGTNDLNRWADFHTRVLGATTLPTRPGNAVNYFQSWETPCLHGGFVQPVQLPKSKGVGKAFPRYGLYVRPEDIEKHLRRLDENQVEHSDPVRTSADGDEGTAIYWEDPDANQFEFWAPDRMPEGAMEGAGPLGVGRISHAVLESRDLQRTADFFDRYCALSPMVGADIDADTLVLPLAAAGRLVFKKTDSPGERTTGRGILRDVHTALVLRPEDFWPNYERMWAELPEWEFDAERDGIYSGDWASLTARTVVHPSPAGRAWHEAWHRGDDWYDPDTNLFHFYGGEPQNGSMVMYEGHSIDNYMEKYLADHGIAFQRKQRP